MLLSFDGPEIAFINWFISFSISCFTNGLEWIRSSTWFFNIRIGKINFKFESLRYFLVMLCLFNRMTKFYKTIWQATSKTFVPNENWTKTINSQMILKNRWLEKIAEFIKPSKVRRNGIRKYLNQCEKAEEELLFRAILRIDVKNELFCCLDIKHCASTFSCLIMFRRKHYFTVDNYLLKMATFYCHEIAK